MEGRRIERGRTKMVDDGAELIEFLRTDVGTIREAKVHDGELAQQLAIVERLAVLVRQHERPADRRSADLLFFSCVHFFGQYKRGEGEEGKGEGRGGKTDTGPVVGQL